MKQKIVNYASFYSSGCYGFFCLSFLICNVASRLGESECFACCFAEIGVPMLRAKLRHKYGIVVSETKFEKLVMLDYKSDLLG